MTAFEWAVLVLFTPVAVALGVVLALDVARLAGRLAGRKGGGR